MTKFEPFTTARAFQGAALNRQPTGATEAWANVAAPEPKRRRTKRREFIDARHAKNVADLIQRLPDEDESIHCWTGVTFPAWSFVGGILRLLPTPRIDVLRVATLGSNKGNTEELCQFLDAGQIGDVRFVGSAYFRDSSQSVWQHLAAELRQRGHRFVACRNHAKLLLFQCPDGRKFVVETSANMRSNNNYETATLTQSADLHDFHGAVLDGLIQQGDSK